MPDANPTAANAAPRPPFATIVSVVGAATRWKALAALIAEPQTSSDLARRFGITLHAMSKHLRVLRDAGIVIMGRGRVHHIAPHLRPSAGSAEIDLGHCVLRLDQLS
jgi:DNA-binding HxlR family transcriptional regulator